MRVLAPARVSDWRKTASIVRDRRSSSHRRIGLGLNFIPTSVRAKGAITPAAVLVRGEDRFGHFELLAPPKTELDADSLAVHAHAVGLYHEIYVAEEARHAKSGCQTVPG